jgi:hypothetical protein
VVDEGLERRRGVAAAVGARRDALLQLEGRVRVDVLGVLWKSKQATGAALRAGGGPGSRGRGLRRPGKRH